MTRKERERQLRRNAILEAAGKVFARDGYFNATMSQIAGVAEFGMGTIYQCFPNKQALFSEVIIEGVEAYSTGLKESLAGKDTWQDKLKTFIEYRLNWVEKQPDLQRLIMEIIYFPVPDIKSQIVMRLREIYEENTGMLKEILSQSLETNKNIDIDLMALVVTGTINSIANDWLMGVLKKIPTEYISGIMQVVAGGEDV
ncbi:MAG TPA: TetR/AcrR family transcriptional regulator [Desulfomonilia bacterium]